MRVRRQRKDGHGTDVNAPMTRRFLSANEVTLFLAVG